MDTCGHIPAMFHRKRGPWLHRSRSGCKASPGHEDFRSPLEPEWTGMSVVHVGHRHSPKPSRPLKIARVIECYGWENRRNQELTKPQPRKSQDFSDVSHDLSCKTWGARNDCCPAKHWNLASTKMGNVSLQPGLPGWPGRLRIQFGSESAHGPRRRVEAVVLWSLHLQLDPSGL